MVRSDGICRSNKVMHQSVPLASNHHFQLTAPVQTCVQVSACLAGRVEHNTAASFLGQLVDQQTSKKLHKLHHLVDTATEGDLRGSVVLRLCLKCRGNVRGSVILWPGQKCRVNLRGSDSENGAG